MNLNVSDIYFSKNDIAIYEDLFACLAEPTAATSSNASPGRAIPNVVVMQLLSQLQLSPESQNLIVAYMKAANHFERKDFYVFLRLASILHSQQQVSKNLVCKFDTPRSFVELISTAVHQISVDRDKSKFTLPPPPMKSKLKRVHTISGTTAGRTFISASMNPSSSSATGAFSSPSLSTAGSGIAGAECQTVATPAVESTFTSKYSQSSSLSNENDAEENDIFDFWRITTEQKEYYKEQFTTLQTDLLGTVRGNVAKVFFEKSGLPSTELSRIWKLSDIDKDGALSLPEFCVAMHLVVLRRNSVEIPPSMPDSLLDIYCNLAQDGHHFPSPFSSSSGSLQARYSLDDMSDHGPSNSEGNTPSTSNSATKQWTLFTESPVPSSAESTSHASPEQPPVNFDYNAESIATNPYINRPVPLRFSPSASPTATLSSRLSNEASSMSPGGHDSESESLSHHLGSGTFLGNMPGEWHVVSDDSGAGHQCKPFSPAGNTRSNGTGTEQPYLISRDGSLDGLMAISGLEERIIARYMPPPEVIIPSSFSSPEELQKSHRLLKDYATAVTKQNESLLIEMLHLVKLVRKDKAGTPNTKP